MGKGDRHLLIMLARSHRSYGALATTSIDFGYQYQPRELDSKERSDADILQHRNC